ncbi:MAG: hypothetical protein Q8P92_05900 [Candidatus Daviesbacteria bacterium]|nr:hypothetical protein [Candidatus Daviesbacteria bacterium]
MAESEIQISKMMDTDIDQVLELGMTATELIDDPHAGHLYNSGMLKRLISSPNGVLLVARGAEELIGFSIGSFHPGFEDGEVRVLEVVASYKNEGIDDRLLTSTLEEL